MASIAPIQLVRQTDTLPILEALRDAGAPTGKLLEQSGLPQSLEEGADGFIPFLALLRFIGDSARSQDIPDLSWRGVIQARPDHLGGWGRAVAQAPTLRRAMLTFCERFKQDVPAFDLGVHVGDEYAWFWRRRPRNVIGRPGDEQGQQYAVSALTRVVRSAAGPSWVPPRILLESATAPWIATIPGFTECQIDFRCPVVAIAVPYDLLGRRTLWANGPEPDAPKLTPPAQTLAGSLTQAFSGLLPAVRPSLELAAEIAEVGPRTLRRHLAEEGTSWRRVLDEARLDACQRLLREPERPLAEIAADLGYSDQANMTRAFRRWTGETPSAYRRRQT